MISINPNTTRTTPSIASNYQRDMHGMILSDEMLLTGLDLAACLADMKEQNATALSQFYDQTINQVYGLALHITGLAEEAEEVVSDVYLQVWEQADRYNKEKGSIMTWVLTICCSKAIDRLRKRQLSNPENSTTET